VQKNKSGEAFVSRQALVRRCAELHEAKRTKHAFTLAWSIFHRNHQTQAALAHYKKREKPQL
jgi:hypothetical protein